ncbi:hypothetical protein BofuT4_uP099720.1 [Botrytis cinerea T4]|uniref:Uncharacterized protein n=1 Tax=Botryotinia fuckeliana (strain T4) TaxID=999810 RepID=G2YC21_BOTF4|nr:hypothetical protein BofuT4_uP099720.1 [Botrytis cinerea T4]
MAAAMVQGGWLTAPSRWMLTTLSTAISSGVSSLFYIFSPIQLHDTKTLYF